jgi:hypothetical protein
MGCSLRKMHQLLSQIHSLNHSKTSAQPDLSDNCNIRTTIPNQSVAPLKHMEVQGFVAKKKNTREDASALVSGFTVL